MTSSHRASNALPLDYLVTFIAFCVLVLARVTGGKLALSRSKKVWKLKRKNSLSLDCTGMFPHFYELDRRFKFFSVIEAVDVLYGIKLHSYEIDYIDWVLFPSSIGHLLSQLFIFSLFSGFV